MNAERPWYQGNKTLYHGPSSLMNEPAFFADRSDADRRHDAEQGSRLLLSAILKAIGKGAARRSHTVADIQNMTARRFKLSPFDMTSARRGREIARPRQIAMYLARHYSLLSLPEIGRRFGDRDHTTVIHAIRQIERLRAEDPELDDDVRQLERELSA